MDEITRITTEYVEAEDRIRLSGETQDGTTVILWCPQRLLARLIPVLCERIEPRSGADPRKEALNAFAQVAAVQELAPLPPVTVSRETCAYTVRAVTIVPGEEAVQLVLKEYEDAEGQRHSLTLRQGELRQWLAILHRQWRRAEWGERLWPHWVVEAQNRSVTAPALAH